MRTNKNNKYLFLKKNFRCLQFLVVYLLSSLNK